MGSVSVERRKELETQSSDRRFHEVVRVPKVKATQLPDAAEPVLDCVRVDE
jgi:hypothetical protein